MSKAEGGAGLDGKSEVLKILSLKCLLDIQVERSNKKSNMCLKEYYLGWRNRNILFYIT